MVIHQFFFSDFLTCRLESKFSEDAIRKAKFLEEMFGGELRQHLDFVSNCKSSVTVEEIVELYLMAETTTGGR
mgnify:CR=1 FL=1